MGPTRRSLLASLAAGGVLGLPARAAQPATKLVLVVSAGGWDPTFSVDPKPDRTAGGPYPDLDLSDPLDRELILAYGPIQVTTNAARRPLARSFFDTWAANTTVINGLWSGSLGHWQAMDQILTGTGVPDAPDIGVIVGSQLGRELPLAQVDLAGVSRFGPLASQTARSGVRGQLAGLLDPAVRFDTPDGPRPDFALTEADRDALAAFHAARTPPARPLWEAARAERADALARAAQLRERAETILAALPAGRRAAFVDQIPFAVELLASDTCAAVAVGTEFAWDTHGDASRQHGAWNGTFGGLAALCEQLSAAGLFERTLIVAVSELGRTPTRNVLGGTDHWPYTSALVIGGAVRGPKLLGATDADSVGLGVTLETGAVQADGELLSYAQLAAGVIEAAGADPEPWLPAVTPLRGLL
jgi:uncharacterized protein (DUF1501 family)